MSLYTAPTITVAVFGEFDLETRSEESFRRRATCDTLPAPAYTHNIIAHGRATHKHCSVAVAHLSTTYLRFYFFCFVHNFSYLRAQTCFTE